MSDDDSRHERPTCRRCKLRMPVASVAHEGERELWIFRCVGCGQETSVALEPLA
jgi:hypothetical protein